MHDDTHVSPSQIYVYLVRSRVSNCLLFLEQLCGAQGYGCCIAWSH